MASLLDHYERKLGKLAARYKLAKSGVSQERKKLKEAKQQQAAAEEARQLAQHVAQAVQQQAHQHIAGVVSRCLTAVFGEEAYEFKILFEKKRGKTEARPIFLRNGQERHPLRASGGGVVDVASFALRLACLALARPKSRLLLVLDEPFRHLSAEYRPAVRQMLEMLADEMKVLGFKKP